MRRSSHVGCALHDLVEAAFCRDVCIMDLQLSWESSRQRVQVGCVCWGVFPHGSSDCVPSVQQLLDEFSPQETSSSYRFGK